VSWRMASSIFVLAVSVCCQSEPRRSTSLGPSELCDIPIEYAGTARLRGVGRLTNGGVLLGDLTCPVVVGREAIPRTVLVEISRFPNTETERNFLRAQDSMSRPLLQVLVNGNLTCKRIREKVGASRDEKSATGFGKTGSVSCVMEDGTVEAMTELF
jgi:hypothetical protein